MLKYLLLALVVIWLLYSPALRGGRRVERPRAKGAPKGKGKGMPPALEEMVACAHCGVHLPAGEALRDGQGVPYCSPAHRQAGPRAPQTPSSTQG